MFDSPVSRACVLLWTFLGVPVQNHAHVPSLLTPLGLRYIPCCLLVPTSPHFPSQTTCIRLPLVFFSFSYSLLLSSRRPTSLSACRISSTTRMQSAELTPKVNQRAPQKPLDSPTRPARPDAEQVPRPSTGERSHSCFPHGFSPGWLSSVSSPSAPKAM